MTRARNISRILSAQEISGDINLSGIVTATEFYGSGSNLTGIAATDDISTSSLVVVGISTLGNVTAGVVTANQFVGNITGTAATFTGNVTVGGTLTYEDVTNIDSIGLITARGGIEVSGIVTARAGYAVTYYGDGSQLSGISVGLTTEAASGGAITLDLSSAQDHKVAATGITTITVSGGTEADSHTVRIINSGIATVGFSTYFLFPSGSTPSLPTADGAISLISFTVNRVGAAGTQLLAGASVNFS
jgi:hypothetical protein